MLKRFWILNTFVKDLFNIITFMHLEFCNLEKSRQQQRDSKMASGDSNENNVTEDVNSTDSDKGAGSSSGSNNYSGKYRYCNISEVCF